MGRLELKPVHVIGVPLDLGGGRRGVDMGPSAFRIAGLSSRSASSARSSSTRGTFPRRFQETQRKTDEHKKYIHEIARVCQTLYTTVDRVARRGRVAGRARRRSQPRRRLGRGQRRLGRRDSSKPIGLIWVDAHGDMNTPDTHHERQRARHAARRAAWSGTGRTRLDRLDTVGAAASIRCSSASAISTNARKTRSARRVCMSSR